MISAAPAPRFLSLSFKSILKQCHQHDLPKVQLQSATFVSSLLPAFLSLESHTCIQLTSPLLAVSFLCFMYSVLQSNQATGCHPKHSPSFLPFVHTVPTTGSALLVTSTSSGAVLDINAQLKCYLPMKPSLIASTRYNQASHFIEAHC